VKNSKDNQRNEILPRRGFLKVGIGILNGFIALLLAVPGLGYLLTPVLSKDSETWIALGPLDKFKHVRPQKAGFKYVTASGYTQREKSSFVWVVHDAAEKNAVTVFSPVCSHTGCNVAWQSKEEMFVCPCHGGRYAMSGDVISGPPPRPLKKIPIKVENGRLFIRVAV